MYINNFERKKILSQFPTIELSYEKRIHKKVLNSNLYIAIPKGPKHFLWFTHYKGNNICFILKLKNRKVVGLEAKHVCFKNELCLGIGTIFYGTLFKTNNINKFSIEDVYYFKGENVKFFKMNQKLNIIAIFFKKYIKQFFTSKKSIIFGMPIIETSYEKCVKEIEKVDYDIYCIQQRLLYKNRVYLNEIYKKEVKIVNVNLLVKPSLIADSYKLYCYDDENNIEVFVGNAIISSYKKSVFMNKLFRKIKENDNLDLLEESDSEDEFEDISDDKYVNMASQYVMNCAYNLKFGLWEPQYVIKDNCCLIKQYKKYKFIK